MIYKVERYIEKYHLLERGDKVLVALSGGADSVALLLALLKLGYSCEAIHCNFHLRDEESDRDEKFVEELCRIKGVLLHVVHFDTQHYAREHKISIEMAARELRYAVFEEYRCKREATAVAVAHHRDDNAETLLLNLIRGTGIRGLRGIQPKNGYIIRPLLCVGRSDIMEYLEWRGVGYVTDSTNLTSDYTRNKIRLEIIPRMAEINPSVGDSIDATAKRVSDAELVYRNAIEKSIERVKNANCIDIKLLRDEVAPAAVLYEILSPLGFNSTQIDNIASSLDGESGKTFSAGDYTLFKDRDVLVISNNQNFVVDAVVPFGAGVIETPVGSLISSVFDFDGVISKQSDIVYLDADKLKAPLALRNIKNGDRFQPFGMRGTKLVSDYLTDKKRSIMEKRRQLVVVDADDAVVWLVGERPAAPFCVGKSTKRILSLEWQALESRNV